MMEKICYCQIIIIAVFCSPEDLCSYLMLPHVAHWIHLFLLNLSLYELVLGPFFIPVAERTGVFQESTLLAPKKKKRLSARKQVATCFPIVQVDKIWLGSSVWLSSQMAAPVQFRKKNGDNGESCKSFLCLPLWHKETKMLAKSGRQGEHHHLLDLREEILWQ